jgi:tetratricopeptide (TPR) repeat protein
MSTRFGRTFPAVFASLAFLLSPLPARSSPPAWVQVRSPNFSVVTDAGEKRGREVALRFEQMRTVFASLMPKARVTLPVPLEIVAFRNTKEMRQFVPLWKGKPTDVSGLFQSGMDRSYIMVDLSVEDPWPVVFHEYGHQLLNCNTTGETALWFDEGFAEYFSTIKINGKQAEVGLVSQERGSILQQSTLIKVTDLFRIGHNSAIYNETGDHRSLFYAQSWLVVHYLYDTNQLTKAGLLFELSTSQSISIEQAIAKAFGVEAAQFDRSLKDYLTRNSFKYYTLPMAPGLQSVSYTSTPLPDPEARAILADVHAHSPDYRERAMQEFELVLKDDPENTTAVRGLGFAYLNNREFDKAREYFKRAAAKNAQDPRVHYYWALLMNEEQAASGHFTDTEEMKKSLRAALALDANFADAYSLLAYAQMADGETDDALKSMRRALELSPRNDSYRFNLAEMYATAQKFDEAEKLLNELRSVGDPMLAARAAQELIRVQNFKLDRQAGVQLSVRQEGQIQVVERSGANQGTPEEIAVLGRSSEETAAPPASGPVKFMKGKLVSVDCNSAPGAVLEVQAAGKAYKFRVSNVAHAIVIGADNFSCKWTNQRVAVNYRETGETEGTLVSIEIQ